MTAARLAKRANNTTTTTTKCNEHTHYIHPERAEQLNILIHERYVSHACMYLSIHLHTAEVHKYNDDEDRGVIIYTVDPYTHTLAHNLLCIERLFKKKKNGSNY